MIENITRKKILAHTQEFSLMSSQKARGLMFTRKRDDFAEVLVFNPPQKIDLHMFFVFYPIDVVFLDRSYLVVAVRERFMPFTCYSCKTPAAYAVELPCGTIKKSGTRIGDTLCFTTSSAFGAYVP